MKIRTDFVTNSSSSSFSLIINIGLKDGSVISYETLGASSDVTGDKSEYYAMGSPLYLAHSKDVNELAQLIQSSFFGCGFVNCGDCAFDGESFYPYDEFIDEDELPEPMFWESDSFLESIKKIPSIKHIDYIEVIGETIYIGSEKEVYRINMDDFSYIYKKSGEFQESEGSGGELCFYNDSYDEKQKCACCKWCGDPVSRENPYIGKWSFSLYCSKECYEEGLKQNKKEVSKR